MGSEHRFLLTLYVSEGCVPSSFPQCLWHSRGLTDDKVDMIPLRATS